MKILCEFSSGGSSFVRAGWGRVLGACGHKFAFWDRNKKGAFDAFSEYFDDSPAVFLGTTYNLDRATIKCLKARPHIKVGLFGSAWGQLTDIIDRTEFPIDITREDEVKLVEELRPDFVFLHCVRSALSDVMGYWSSKLGLNVGSVLNGADTFLYGKGISRRELECDAAITGGYWPYKARNLDPFIFPLSGHFNLKVFGNSRWPLPEYLGSLSVDDERDLYNTAKVCLNVHEPHSSRYGYDLIERPFKAAACGGFVLSDYVEGANEVFGGGVLTMAKTPVEYRDLLVHYLENESERKNKQENLTKVVLGAHTYFERVADIFRGIGLPEQADHVIAQKELK